jgi:flagellar basal-body rod protein FlgC
MSDFSSAFDLTTSGLRAQAKRLRHLSENIANVDTPGYRRKTVSFHSVASNKGMVEAGPVRLGQGPLRDVFDPHHPLADNTGHYASSNVDLLIEITDAREAQRSYEANLKMFDQTRQMSSALMDLLRK